ncbi:MAG: methyltransferase domain-containing protein [Sphingobacteriales bacterium]|nr:methyltransferase domain-containing protein [Sphingobacteriales bacterium]
MTNFNTRSYTKELLDSEDIPFRAIVQNLKELNIINKWLGGHNITLRGLKSSIGNASTITICEVGCGGGDNLFAIYNYCSSHNIKVNFIGIDMNPYCIAFAQQQYPDLKCKWLCQDYASVEFTEQKPDIIFSSLFCHHFTDEQLVDMLQWMKQNSNKAFFINDLQRHWLAYYLIKYITKFFSKSYLVKNDACLSVCYY